MKIGIANDHAGTELKVYLSNYLESIGHEVVNYGTDSTDSYDYPIAGEDLANGVVSKEVDLGIAICGTGIGISIACNKVNGIRACATPIVEVAQLSREHNNANILCLGARFVHNEQAVELVNAFINTPFSEGERHIRRVALLSEIEKKQK